MTVKEYREKNPHCKYCRYVGRGCSSLYCTAIKKKIVFNKAKKRPIYEAKWYLN